MTRPPSSHRFALEAGLTRASLTLDQASERIAGPGWLHLTGVPGGALGLVMAQTVTAHDRPLLIVTADSDAMRRVAGDLDFFLSTRGRPRGSRALGSSRVTKPSAGAGPASPSPPNQCEATSQHARETDPSLRVLRYPGSELSPYVAASADRRAEMERMATLARLANGARSPIVVTTGDALMRKVPPKKAIEAVSLSLTPLLELDRDDLCETLQRAGYLRVPLVEDPGTFAVRGSLVDVFPAEQQNPVRVEFEDDFIANLRAFDPDDQRTREDVASVLISPVRALQWGGRHHAAARARVSELCDDMNMPSSKRAALLDALDNGHQRLGLDALLPAVDPELETLFDYLPAATGIVVHDPTASIGTIHKCLERAHADYAERGKVPAYPVHRLFLDEFTLKRLLEDRAVTVVHRLAVGGEPDDGESPLSALESTGTTPAESLGGEDHRPLQALLKQQRQAGGGLDTLAPLAEQVEQYLVGGLRVLLSAGSHTQAERIANLLRAYDVKVTKTVEVFTRERLSIPAPGRAEIVVGPLSEGFVLAAAGLACLTETEIFGARPARTKKRAAKPSDGQNFLEDLRELAVGDYIVHVKHGVGRYLGLQKKLVPISRYEELQGLKPVGVEVLAVEYTGGTLYLPVTRLNQVQKHSARDAKPPKLDKLGGQTFARTKQRVRGEVRKLADDLLKLYAERAANTRQALPPPDRTYAEFEASFPYDETPDQDRAIREVLSDLEAPQAMDRVVCGDVGFGKTEVAMRAAFRTALAGKQVALLCPTTVLAQQHLQTFRERMSPYALEIEGLSRFVPRKEQSSVLKRAKEGKTDVVIGTHRLLSKDVHFQKLGLLIVDEEQRFGVAHKERIKAMRAQVDVLTLSATPIPRTLQLAVTGIRDLSLISTPPVNRRAIRTFVTRWDERVLREALERELARGGQVFFVHNRIDSLHERATRLSELVPSARISIAHGQMGEAALENVMRDFVHGDTDILCSTAIVESGLDIPRANTIMIDRADHYGLAQLYQLRGRVGRANERAYCYLIAPAPSAMTDEARSRIEALERFTELGSGFKIASLDLELRGAGDILGADQSGSVSAVGFDLFVQMLEEAVAELRGQPKEPELDPELNLDIPLSIPDDYVEDVGQRLALYKRLGGARTSEAVQTIGQELEDRFGPPPAEVLSFVRAMAVKPALRTVRALGCEATPSRVTLHLSQDAPLNTERLSRWLAQNKPRVTLTPAGKLTFRFDPNTSGDSIERIDRALRDLWPNLNLEAAS